jgi:cytosine/adenosine deaminase-related metal-dependent hydrolase
MFLLKASHVICKPGLILSPGAIRIRGNKIVEVATSLEALEGEKVLEVGNSIIFPGFINSHCHLEYTLLKGKLSASKGYFVDWLQTLIRFKKTFSAIDYLKAHRMGIDLLLKSATTCVLDIVSIPEIFLFESSYPLRVFSFLELIDVNCSYWTDEKLAGSLLFFTNQSSSTAIGLSPHAPYTASPELYELSKRWCLQKNGLLMTHVAESYEEYEMFTQKKGGLFDFISRIEQRSARFKTSTPLRFLAENELLTKNAFLVHLNYLDETDWDWFKKNSWNVVYCPKSHAFFGHDPFPLRQLLSRGVNVVLGTDSLASNDSLDMRKEIQKARQAFPEISIGDWWKMVTVNPAKALGLQGKLGEIAVGAYADLAVIPFNSSSSDPLEALLYEQKEPSVVIINGKVVHSTEAL